MQFMILLSALLASLSGMVAGERQPVRAAAQVQSSAFVSTAQAEAHPAVAQVREQAADAAGVAAREPKGTASPQHATQPTVRERLSLKQSWLE